jgi:cell division protein FtsI/penicillin-binding protein 2
MSQANRKDNGLTIGGEPRADLLPPEIKRDVKLKAQRGNLGALIVLVIVIVGAGYGFVTFLAQGAQVELVAANEQTIRILNQQTEFAEVTNLRGQVALATEARLTGSSTEINWEEFIDAAVDAHNRLRSVHNSELGTRSYGRDQLRIDLPGSDEVRTDHRTV